MQISADPQQSLGLIFQRIVGLSSASLNLAGQSMKSVQNRLKLTKGGRLKYFYSTTSPLTLLASPTTLKQAQNDVVKFETAIKESGKNGYMVDLQTRDRYWNAKQRMLRHSSG